MASPSDDLAGFVREALSRGIPRPDIATALQRAGWSREKIDDTLERFAEVDFPLPVPRPRAYLSPREAFLYLLLFTTLFLSAFHLGAVLFELIEKAFPDPVGPSYSATWLRWSLSALVVAFPIFLALTARLERELGHDPTKRSSKVRKWLTYLTLFVAAGFLAGDLMSMVYHLLEGELTIRFLLKVLVVGVLAGIVFIYYLRDIQREA